MCEAGRNVTSSSCRLPWTADEVSDVAVDMVPVTMDVQHVQQKEKPVLLH